MRDMSTYCLKKRENELAGKMRIHLKMSFGEILVEGDDANEILTILEGMPAQFIEKVESLVNTKLKPPLQTQLQGTSHQVC